MFAIPIFNRWQWGFQVANLLLKLATVNFEPCITNFLPYIETSFFLSLSLLEPDVIVMWVVSHENQSLKSKARLFKTNNLVS